MDLRNLVEKSFDEQVEESKKRPGSLMLKLQYDQKKTVGTARPCKCLGLLVYQA